MSIAQWNDELATGVSEVDKQHKELIRMVSDLHDALSTGKGKDIVDSAITFLSNYVIQHFQAEEKLMQESGYPDYQAHKREHELFVDDFVALVKEFNATAGASLLAITLQRKVVQWLINHIMKVDKAMAQFVVEGPGGKVA